MASVGFSVPGAHDIRVEQAQTLLNPQLAWATAARRGEAITQILCAYIAVAKAPPDEARLQRWAAEIAGVVDTYVAKS